eukprot:GHVS01012814.1.p1 GENE.GHVS01012814.1~~GHVS01012814.1.p1  ORF type:complete len:111 (-),score=15.51 GHVS01012814.1:34-366(-)
MKHEELVGCDVVVVVTTCAPPTHQHPLAITTILYIQLSASGHQHPLAITTILYIYNNNNSSSICVVNMLLDFVNIGICLRILWLVVYYYYYEFACVLVKTVSSFKLLTVV